MKSSRICNATINNYLVDYALTIDTAIVILVSYIPKMQDADVYVERIELPEGHSIEPTVELCADKLCTNPALAKPRPWGTPLR